MVYNPEQQQLFQPYQIGSQGITPVKKQSGFNKFLFGQPEQFQRTPTQTPQGMSFLESLLSGAQQGLQNPSAGFEPIREDVTKQFHQETLPAIAERFTAGDAQRSSAFKGALGNASSGLAQRLAAMQSQYGLENRRALLDQGRLGLTPQFEPFHRPAQQGFLESLLGPALSSGGKVAGTGLGQFNAGQGGGGQDTMQLLMKILPLLV